jgi:hypothetical protein
MAFDRGREASFAGTGFVIAGKPEFALAITAKHVLVEGAGRLQRPLAEFAPSALFLRANVGAPSLDPVKLKVVWMGSEHAEMLNTSYVNYADPLDVACCVVVPQDEHVTSFRPTSIPLDTSVLHIGDVVHMVSFVDMAISELIPPADASGIGQTLSVGLRVCIRIGVVTGIYLEGYRQYRWPCFTTSIPPNRG